jgi:hypothetical protein
MLSIQPKVEAKETGFYLSIAQKSAQKYEKYAKDQD